MRTAKGEKAIGYGLLAMGYWRWDIGDGLLDMSERRLKISLDLHQMVG